MQNVVFRTGRLLVIGPTLNQWDYGQQIKVSGLPSTANLEVHLANISSAKAVVKEVTVNEDGSIQFDIPNALLQVAEQITCYIYSDTGTAGETIRTIILPVSPRKQPEDYITPADTERTQLEQWAAEEETRKANEAVRVQNETARENAESTRVNNESNRISAETSRISAESSRITAENSRVTSEASRINAEHDRVSVENSRVTAENNRVIAENGRVSAEQTRVNNETIRNNAENIRVDNESDRISAENGRVSAENNRVSAETARVNAETARQTGYATMDGRINSLSETIADLAGFVGYTEDDIYGVEVDFVNRTFTRLAGAVGKTPGADFDSILAFGGRRRCNLADNGTVNAYYGDPGYIEDGSNGQVMVEQPKFYYKVVPLQLEKIQDGKGYHMRKARYYVSDVPKVGFKLHPAFIRNGVVKDKIYLSAYEGSIYDESAGTYLLADEQIADFNADKLSSIAYAKPASGLTQNLTRANTRKLAENRGNGWQLSDVLSASVTQMLFIIEYASFNIQYKIGLGIVNKTDDGSTNMSELTGATTNLGNASGMAAGTNGLVSISYRGEENFWGNVWEWVDGLNIYNQSDLYVADHDFVDDSSAEPYKDAGITLAKANGYVSAFGYNEEFDWLFFPSETLGDSALPAGDYFSQNVSSSTGYRAARLGGYWANGSYAGAFYWHVNNTSSYRSQYIGGRLVYVPPVA